MRSCGLILKFLGAGVQLHSARLPVLKEPQAA